MTPGDPQLSPVPPGTPHHRRTVVVEVADAADGLIEVAGRLRDERPWATEPLDLPVVHDLGLTVTVSLADFVVRSVRVDFDTYPHAECVDIAEAHQALVGRDPRSGLERRRPRAARRAGRLHAPARAGQVHGPDPAAGCLLGPAAAGRTSMTPSTASRARCSP